MSTSSVAEVKDLQTGAAAPTFESLGLTDARCLLVASTGGHLAELQRVEKVIRPSTQSTTVTFDTEQSRSLIGDVRFIRYIRPRDLRGIAEGARRLNRIIGERRWDAVISTGSAIALSALPLASAAGLRTIYIESYSRFDGPSMSGRVLQTMSRRIELYTQHESWRSRKWNYTGSVLDSLDVRPSRHTTNNNSIFVTLGTIQPYRFDALVDQVIAKLPDSAQVIWQLGATTRRHLPGEVHQHMSRDAFLDAARRSGRVISHAGTGTAIDLIEMGHKPILVPRRASRNEHVDDHQLEIVADLHNRDLVTAREVADLTIDDLTPES